MMEKLLTVDNLKNVSLAALLLFILYAGASGWWVYSKDYESMKSSYETQLKTALAEREEWRKEAISALKLSRELSPARLPIMASAQPNDMTVKDFQEQINLIRDMNEN